MEPIQAIQGIKNPFSSDTIQKQKLNQLQQQLSLFTDQENKEKTDAARLGENGSDNGKVSVADYQSKINEITKEKEKIQKEILQIQALTNYQ